MLRPSPNHGTLWLHNVDEKRIKKIPIQYVRYGEREKEKRKENTPIVVIKTVMYKKKQFTSLCCPLCTDLTRKGFRGKSVQSGQIT